MMSCPFALYFSSTIHVIGLVLVHEAGVGFSEWLRRLLPGAASSMPRWLRTVRVTHALDGHCSAMGPTMR